MNDMTAPRAQFTHMKDGTGEDWQIIAKSFGDFSKGLSDRIMTHLRLLEGDFGGFKIDRFQHCLQTATLAHRDGKDDEYVVCALLHDIGDPWAPSTTPTWPPCCWNRSLAMPTTGW